ncbi:MAG: hypothetical protein HYS86_03255 [Candidatus Chisholmbacteria bacterium]|nr:hypothetical protein [Candidatus Chisholmbacteria bacterium]
MMTKRDPKGLVTNEYLESAIQHVVDTMGEWFEKLMGGQKNIEMRLVKVEKKLTKVEGNVLEVKRQVTDLKYDTPTQKEFRELKAKVDRFHPSN